VCNSSRRNFFACFLNLSKSELKHQCKRTPTWPGVMMTVCDADGGTVACCRLQHVAWQVINASVMRWRGVWCESYRMTSRMSNRVDNTHCMPNRHCSSMTGVSGVTPGWAEYWQSNPHDNIKAIWSYCRQTGQQYRTKIPEQNLKHLVLSHPGFVFHSLLIEAVDTWRAKE